VKFDTFLEIGFASGITNTILHKFFKFSEIVAIDAMDSIGGSPETFKANLRFKNLCLLTGYSNSEYIIKKAKKLGPYDIIFVDGGHDLRTVAHDYAIYSEFLSNNGVMIFHDICSNHHPGVASFWKELRENLKGANWKLKEFFEPGHMQEFGIGVIYHDKATNKSSTV